MIRVEITEEAQQDIDNIGEFLLQNWNEKVLLNFMISWRMQLQS